MSRRTRQILNAKEGQISRAGKLFFGALFGDHEEVAREVRDDIVRESAAKASGDAEAITTTGFSFVRCSSCAREQGVAADVDVRSLEHSGWRLVAGAWRCPFCVSR